MKRRNFLSSLIALPAGIMAAAKVHAQPPGLNLDEIFEQLYRIRRNRGMLGSRQVWFVDYSDIIRPSYFDFKTKVWVRLNDGA